MAVLKKSERLKKELGLLNVYALATGTTLSAGFFLLPGLAATQVGPALPLAYLIAALPVIPAMFSNMELATAMPRAGGIYYFLDRSLGPVVGAIGGLGTWMALSLKAAFALIGMGAYLHLFFPSLQILPIAIACCLLFGLINLWGAKSAGSLQLSLVGVLLLILVWFMGGITQADPAYFSDLFGYGGEALLATAGLVYISYVGLTKVASISEEVANPGRNLPLGVFLSLGTAVVVYVVGTSVMVGCLPMETLQGDFTPAATVAAKLAGTFGRNIMVVAALLAFFAVANAGILSASRYPLAMSRDAMLPGFFGKLNRRNIPTRGVYTTVGGILLILVVFDPLKIAKLASAFQLLLFSLNCLAVIVMRESKIDSYDPAFRSPFYPWMQVIGMLLPFVLISAMGWLPTFFTGGLVAAGAGWYFYYARGRTERGGAILHVFERLGRKRFEGLDTELRGILKEKGLRQEDPFDEIVARSHVVDVDDEVDYEDVAGRVATLMAERVPTGAEEILAGFLRGTRVGMTPVAHGVALPHLRLPGLDLSEMVLVRTRKGMRIEVADSLGHLQHLEQPVRAAFFFVSPEDNPGQHLRILARIAERVDDDDFMPNWLGAENEQQLNETLLHNERYLPLHVAETGKTARLAGQSVAALVFPRDCLIAIVRRGDFTFVPRGSTVLQTGDRLTIIGQPEGIGTLREEME